MPQTRANITIDIAGFKGKAISKEFTPENSAKGYAESQMTLGTPASVTVAPHSVKAITAK
jgi:hypothetical protein